MQNTLYFQIKMKKVLKILYKYIFLMDFMFLKS